MAPRRTAGGGGGGLRKRRRGPPERSKGAVIARPGSSWAPFARPWLLPSAEDPVVAFRWELAQVLKAAIVGSPDGKTRYRVHTFLGNYSAAVPFAELQAAVVSFMSPHQAALQAAQESLQQRLPDHMVGPILARAGMLCDGNKKVRPGFRHHSVIGRLTMSGRDKLTIRVPTNVCRFWEDASYWQGIEGRPTLFEIIQEAEAATTLENVRALWGLPPPLREPGSGEGGTDSGRSYDIELLVQVRTKYSHEKKSRRTLAVVKVPCSCTVLDLEQRLRSWRAQLRLSGCFRGQGTFRIFDQRAYWLHHKRLTSDASAIIFSHDGFRHFLRMYALQQQKLTFDPHAVHTVTIPLPDSESRHTHAAGNRDLGKASHAVYGCLPSPPHLSSLQRVALRLHNLSNSRVELCRESKYAPEHELLLADKVIVWEDQRLIDVMPKPEGSVPSMATLCREFRDVPQALRSSMPRRPFIQTTFEWADSPEQIEVVWLRRLLATSGDNTTGTSIRKVHSVPRYYAE